MDVKVNRKTGGESVRQQIICILILSLTWVALSHANVMTMHGVRKQGAGVVKSYNPVNLGGKTAKISENTPVIGEGYSAGRSYGGTFADLTPDQYVETPEKTSFESDINFVASMLDAAESFGFSVDTSFDYSSGFTNFNLDGHVDRMRSAHKATSNFAIVMKIRNVTSRVRVKNEPGVRDRILVPEFRDLADEGNPEVFQRIGSEYVEEIVKGVTLDVILSLKTEDVETQENFASSLGLNYQFATAGGSLQAQYRSMAESSFEEGSYKLSVIVTGGVPSATIVQQITDTLVDSRSQGILTALTEVTQVVVDNFDTFTPGIIEFSTVPMADKLPKFTPILPPNYNNLLLQEIAEKRALIENESERIGFFPQGFFTYQDHLDDYLAALEGLNLQTEPAMLRDVFHDLRDDVFENKVYIQWYGGKARPGVDPVVDRFGNPMELPDPRLYLYLSANASSTAGNHVAACRNSTENLPAYDTWTLEFSVDDLGFSEAELDDLVVEFNFEPGTYIDVRRQSPGPGPWIGIANTLLGIQTSAFVTMSLENLADPGVELLTQNNLLDPPSGSASPESLYLPASLFVGEPVLRLLVDTGDICEYGQPIIYVPEPTESGQLRYRFRYKDL